MRRRVRQHESKAPPSAIHPAYLSRARFPPARHSSSPSPRTQEPGANGTVGRQGSPSLPPPTSTAPSRALYRHAPCFPHRNESTLQRIPSGRSHQIHPPEMAIAPKDKPRAGAELRGSFARKRPPNSAPLLLDHLGPCPPESQREISLFGSALPSSRTPDSRGTAESKRTLARVPGSDPRPSALWLRLAYLPADRRSCKRL